jgi:hypothetical protein
MSEVKQAHNPRDRPDNSGNHHDHRPYWKRAHRSVSFWVAVVLMLAAMVIYVMSDDLGGWPHGRQRQSISVPAGN